MRAYERGWDAGHAAGYKLGREYGYDAGYKAGLAECADEIERLYRCAGWMIRYYDSEAMETKVMPYNPATFDNPEGDMYCSGCGECALLNGHEESVPSKWCPHCGAEMNMDPRLLAKEVNEHG